LSGQTEIINFLRSLKPFVNKQGVEALNTLENVFDLLNDPKVGQLTSSVQSFSNLRKEQSLQNKDKGKQENNLRSLKGLLKQVK